MSVPDRPLSIGSFLLILALLLIGSEQVAET